MDLFRAARCAAAVLFVATGCPRSPGTTSPPARVPADESVTKLARILRAADRRIVDEDLRALLADPDPALRAKAALALGQIGDPSSIAELHVAATDAAAATRAAAAFAIGLLADPSSEDVLERLSGDAAPEVRALAAEALARLHLVSGMGAVRTLLTDPEPAVRTAAALGAWKFADPEPLLEALIADVGSTDDSVRAASSYALARLASAPVAPPSSGAQVGRLSGAAVARARTALVGRVGDDDPEVRMNVARGLAAPHAGIELAAVGALSKDPIPGVRINAVRALGYPGIPVAPYLDRAIKERDPAVARAAFEALGGVGGATALSTLSRIASKIDDVWVREAMLLAMAKLDPPETADLVAGLLRNTDARLRAVAAELIAGHKEPWAVDAARSLIREPAAQVQALAVPVLAGQDGPVSTLLVPYFTTGDPVVRAAVAEAVGARFAEPQRKVESFDELFARLDEVWSASASDAIPDAKLAVVDAAAKAGKGDGSSAMLTRALADTDVLVRRRAALRLKDVYGEDRSEAVGPSSDRPLEDYERIARWAKRPHAAVVSLQRPGMPAGTFTIALDAEAAPMAAWNFAQLAGKGYFDGAKIHRVVPNFVMQDGDPRGDGFGGPGYSIRDEFNPLRFEVGVAGMASDGKDTAGSQWFVTLSPQPHLDGRYTSFGRVVQGFREVVSQTRPGDAVVSVRIQDPAATQPPPAR